MRYDNVVLPDPRPSYDVEKDISKELMKMSFGTRLAVQEEMHGVRCTAPEETPARIGLSLDSFDSLLNEEKERNPTNHLLRNVIRTSQSSDSTCYLNDEEIRLRFLRAESFKVTEAVNRMLNFLELASDLFGDFVAKRPIQVSDFSRKELPGLNESRSQLLPFRDRSGRRIIANVGCLNFNLNLRLMVKILLYLYWVASEDVETQQKGVVLITYAFDEEGSEWSWERSIRPLIRKSTRTYHKQLNACIPNRVVSIQHYYSTDSPFFRSLSALYFLGLDSSARKIYKVHYGGHVELLYQMAGYGIQPSMMPITSSGTLKYNNHSQFLSVQRDREMDPVKFLEDFASCPNSEDVVFRQGPAFRNNPGNIFFRELIHQFCEEHRNASRDEKCEITKLVMEEIQNRQGRFLIWNPKRKCWIVCQDSSAIRKKIASALKQYNRQRRAAVELNEAFEIGRAIVDDLGADGEEKKTDVSPSDSDKSKFNPKRRRLMAPNEVNSLFIGNNGPDSDDSCGCGYFLSDNNGGAALA